VPAGVVVHNHYIPAFDLERMDVLVLPPKEYGSVELAEAVAEAAPRSQRMYVRRHGLVFWAEKAEDCAEMLTTAIDSVGGMR
jgi:fluorothreonine transaldolase